MQKNLAHVDGIMIDRICQPAADWIDQVMTIDCFRIARSCMDISALAWILSQAAGSLTAIRIGIPGLEVFQFTLIVVGLGAISVLRTSLERAGGAGGGRQGGRANPLRAAMYTHRLACLLWLIGLLVKTATAPAGLSSVTLLAVGGFATAALYFGACSNRPPKRREFGSHDWRGRPVALQRVSFH